jgi:lipopolysaccharide transport system ATP-binding protein
MSAAAIRATGLWKQYRIGTRGDRSDTFREAVMGAVTASVRRLRWRRDEEARQYIWVLRNVGLEVQSGDVVGIIGRNGAGKTTLLKILSRITAPTRGRVEVRGRLASLLEVGTGFHPELTGRENIFVNGAILGMSRQEIQRRFDEIVAFAEVERFLDTPVKRYSSGMAVRLAFSVAAHLDPDILLVDEVLAVGDAQFQRRCLGKLGEAGRDGRTVLFVSHNLGAISKLCSRSILLGQGSVVIDGSVTDAAAAYARELSRGN